MINLKSQGYWLSGYKIPLWLLLLCSIACGAVNQTSSRTSFQVFELPKHVLVGSFSCLRELNVEQCSILYTNFNCNHLLKTITANMEGIATDPDSCDTHNVAVGGNLTKKDVLRWSIPESFLRTNSNEIKKMRSDAYRFGPSRYSKFCLLAKTNPGMLEVFGISICRIPIAGAATPSKEEPPITVAFSLLDIQGRCHHTCVRVLEDNVQCYFDNSCYTTHQRMFVKEGRIQIHCTMDVDEVLKEAAMPAGWRPEVCIPDVGNLYYDLAKDLRALLDNGLHSDVTLSTKGQDFHVHRSILAARSPVFAAMFEHDTLETRQNRVVIEDLTSDAMSQLLRFLYSGETDELTPEELLSLFIGADKYNLQNLRQKCSILLCPQITTSMALKVLVVANLHMEENLKHAAVQVVLDSAMEVMKTDDWLTFLREYPEIANTIILSLAMKSAKLSE